MHEILNRTPFSVALLPWLDATGLEHAIVVVKGTYVVGPRGALSLAEAQRGPLYADDFYGEPGRSSVRFVADVSPRKSGTDVAMVGAARSLQRVPTLDVELRVGAARKVVRVFGKRRFSKTGAEVRVTRPEPIFEVPLVFENAFGGPDLSHADAQTRPVDARNPVGKGFISDPKQADVDGRELPELEDPDALLRAPGDRPPPASFGFVAPSWEPRTGFAGTYDEAWRVERSPLLPVDFDERFFRAATRGLGTDAPLRGDERLRATNVSLSGGPVELDLPARAIDVRFTRRGETTTTRAPLDTVTLDVDGAELVLVWRAMLACPRAFLEIDRVRVAEVWP